MAANPSGAHQAGELSLAEHRWVSSEGFGRVRHNGTSAGTPTPELKFVEWTLALRSWTDETPDPFKTKPVVAAGASFPRLRRTRATLGSDRRDRPTVSGLTCPCL